MRPGGVWLVAAGKAGWGEVRLGTVWHSSVRQAMRGKARPGEVSCGTVWQARHGRAGRGLERFGTVAWRRDGLAVPSKNRHDICTRRRGMIYQWRIPDMFGISAQEAGAVIESCKNAEGFITPEAVVNKARPTTSVIHRPTAL